MYSDCGGVCHAGSRLAWNGGASKSGGPSIRIVNTAIQTLPPPCIDVAVSAASLPTEPPVRTFAGPAAARRDVATEIAAAAAVGVRA